MNTRTWLGLLLIAVSMLTTARPTTAQQSRSRSSLPSPFNSALTKQSHYPLEGRPDPANAEEMMAQRLQELQGLQELHQMQDRVQELLKDQDFLKNLNLSDAKLEELQKKLLQGNVPSNDPNWERLLQQARTRTKLNDRHIELLRRLAERPAAKSEQEGEKSPNGNAADPALSPPDSSPPQRSQPSSSQTTAESERPMFDRLQEESTRWLLENLDDVGGDLVEAITKAGGKDENGPLAELLRAVHQPDFPGMDLRENSLLSGHNMESLTRRLSRVGDFLERQSSAWSKIDSFFRAPPAPSLPRIGSPSVSMSSFSASHGDGWLPATLSMLMLGVIVLLLCVKGFGSKAANGTGEDAEWRLGNWPVPPNGVSTRQDVVRAFEYLALLTLGRAAAACHHRELAECLAEQDSGSSARRQAAETLAWLYEQARYAPAGESLSPGQLSDARHALCYLAGVTAA